MAIHVADAEPPARDCRQGRLTLSPWVNHRRQVPLYVNACGLGTSAIHAAGGIYEIDFDFVEHRLIVRTSGGPDRGFALAPMSVASFYRQATSELRGAGVTVTINVMPNEVPTPIRFPDDEVHASDDADAVHRFWKTLVQADRLWKASRTSFLGKCSPVHFFFGQLRPGRHALLRPPRAFASGWLPQSAGLGHTRSVAPMKSAVRASGPATRFIRTRRSTPMLIRAPPGLRKQPSNRARRCE